MRLVLWLVTAVAVVYGGYWFVGSRALLGGTETALEELRAAGLADYEAVDLTGFPSRFDLTLDAPELASGDGSLRWSAPELRVYALSYKPHHIITVLPSAMTLRIGGETIAVRSDDLRASAVFGLAPNLPLDHAQSVGKAIALDSDRGWGAQAAELRVAIRQGAAPTEQEIGAEVFAPGLSGLPAALLEEGGALPAKGDWARLDAVLRLDAPLDRFAPMRGIAVTGADLRALSIDWGPVEVRGSGGVEISPSGYPEGRVDLAVRNWRAGLDLAVALGAIREEIAPTVGNALEQLALAGGDAENLKLPLVFQNGRMSLGPVPLGPAPRLQRQ